MEVKIEDNTQKVLEALERAGKAALEAVGMQAESYAKKLAPVGTPESTGIPGYSGGRLRNSISHQVDETGKFVAIGSPVEYAPYVELGTGKYYETPPEWIENEAEKGTRVQHMKAQPYIRPAITEHADEYKQIMRAYMEKG